MPLQYYLKRLYSLDTLDTRFPNSSKAPLSESAREHAVESSSSDTGNNSTNVPRQVGDAVSGTNPSRWNTWEYYLYYFCFLTIVPMMFKVPYDVSNR